MSHQRIRRVKDTARLILEVEAEDLEAIQKTLNYLTSEYAKIGYTDYLFNLLKASFQKLKRNFIAGTMNDADYLKKCEIFEFSIQKYLESTSSFKAMEFEGEYALFLQYARQSFTQREVLAKREELRKGKELSGFFLKDDLEGESKFLELALINLEKVIHGEKIIDKDYLLLKSRYVSLQTDLIDGIVPTLSDFYKVLAQIKKAAKLFFADTEDYSNTNLNQEVLKIAPKVRQ